MTDRHMLMAGALALMVGVAAGAFGAHGLKRIISPDLLQVWNTAVLYHLIHALGLIALAALDARFGSTLLSWAGAVMLAGIFVFSGSLYVLALTGTKWLGAITPLGGFAFIVSWLMVAIAAFRTN